MGLCGINKSIQNRNSVLARGEKRSDNHGHLWAETDSTESTREASNMFCLAFVQQAVEI